jgi:hypothetical protein
MRNLLIPIMDMLAASSAALAAWFWYLASRRQVRRVSRFEQLDAADINRIVVNINRNQILNSRAALAAAVAALCTAARFALDLFFG